jgi:hypothetical protein
MAFEVKIRVNYPESFWITSRVSFKKDIWQNVVVKNGLPSFEYLEDLVTPLLSPELEFIYPLDWAFEEQIVLKDNDGESSDESNEEEQEFVKKKIIDWELILELWEPIFNKFINNEYFNITELKDMDKPLQEKWLSEKKNIEIFMMFVITELTFGQEVTEFEKMDERVMLFNKLCKKDEKYRKLIGKTITAKLMEKEMPLILENIFISPYTICIKD